MGDHDGNSRPPRLARRLLSFLTRREATSDILQSLDDLYRVRAQEHGTGRARLWYWRQALSFATTWSWVRSALPPGRGGIPDSVFQDVRFAARGIRKNPTFSIVVVLTAAFGITISTLVFSVINAAILRPLPHVRSPEELVMVFREAPSRTGQRANFSYADFELIRDQTTSLEDVVAVVRWVRFMMRSGSAMDRQVVGAEVSENYFQLLGVPMLLGRGIVPGDADSGDAVAVIGYARWQRDFDGSSNVLGQILRVDGREHTVVGVAPPGLNWLNGEPVEAALWVPIRDGLRGPGGGNALALAGRRAAGVTVAQVQAELDALAVGLASANREAWADQSGEQVRMRVMTDRQSRVDLGGPSTGAALMVYFVLVATVMLITCSNVANLLLNKAMKRRSEIAMRLALGAGRGRLVRQLLTEGMLLFLLAGSLGLFLIHWTTRLMSLGWAPQGIPADITVDGRVAAFAFAVAAFSGLVFGLAPALQSTRPNLVGALKGTGTPVRFRRLGTRNLFILGQVAGSMILVSISALLVRDVQMATRLDVGFDPENVTVLALNLGHGDYDRASGRQLIDDLTERLERRRGIEAVGVSTWVPLSDDRWTTRLVPQGDEPALGENPLALFNAVTPGYFDLVRIPVVLGRDFTLNDDDDAPGVAIVNRAFVDEFWPDQTPVGRTVILDGWEESVEVVGVVRNARYTSSDFLGDSVSSHIWLPRAQVEHHLTHVHVRGSGDQASIATSMREDLRTLDEDLPIVELAAMQTITDRALGEQRAAAVMFGGFGVAALFLAILGIYGVLAFAVMDRARELGIRMAVGGTRERLISMIVGQSLKVSASGILVGLALSALVARGMRSIMVGMDSLDPSSLGASVAILTLAAVVASLVPALRAASTDPVESLRSE